MSLNKSIPPIRRVWKKTMRIKKREVNGAFLNNNDKLKQVDLIHKLNVKEDDEKNREAEENKKQRSYLLKAFAFLFVVFFLYIISCS